MNRYFIAFIIVLLAAGGFYYYTVIWNETEIPLPGTEDGTPTNGSDRNKEQPPQELDNLIRITKPRAGETVRSPLVVEGEARGNWYFEASFPVKILDAQGNELGITPAQAQGEWMTTDFVPFRAEIMFTTPATETGVVIFEKDNPSGLPEHADERRVPVRFDVSNVPTHTIKLYYYNEEKDKDVSGNIQCSREGLEAVERRVPITQTPIQDAIRLLLRGVLTEEEKARGLSTEYPLPGLTLESASLRSGTLTITFTDPENSTGGGSCRVNILWSQIKATAQQFSEVSAVQFMPEELFQP